MDVHGSATPSTLEKVQPGTCVYVRGDGNTLIGIAFEAIEHLRTVRALAVLRDMPPTANFRPHLMRGENVRGAIIALPKAIAIPSLDPAYIRPRAPTNTREGLPPATLVAIEDRWAVTLWHTGDAAFVDLASGTISFDQPEGDCARFFRWRIAVAQPDDTLEDICSFQLPLPGS